MTVTDDAYHAANWNGSAQVPTKNAVRDVIEGLSAVYQPLDATLTDFAGQTIAADKLVYGDGADSFAALSACG